MGVMNRRRQAATDKVKATEAQEAAAKAIESRVAVIEEAKEKKKDTKPNGTNKR